MKFNNKIVSVLISASLLLSFTGCNKAEPVVVDTLGDELRMSDFRGGVLRTVILQNKITDVVDEMKTNNQILRQDAPYDFWTTSGYQDFVSTLFDTPVLDNTQWFTEEECDWDTAISQMIATPSQITTGAELQVSVVRNEKDDYTMQGVPVSFPIISNGITKQYSGTSDYRILYNCDKDWCKAYAVMNLDDQLPRITAELYEYQRITNDIFAVQTSKERAIVVFNPVQEGTDIRERTVKEFYYSRLVLEGERTTFDEYEPLPEEYLDEKGVRQRIEQNAAKNNLYKNYYFVNEQGDLNIRYGVNDSMFLKSTEEINPYWVFEDKALQQGIVYKDGILVVTTYNKLSTEYERFIYTRADADTSSLQKLEDLVVIKDLVGIQPVEKSTVVAPVLEQSVTEAEAELEAEIEAEETTNGVDASAEDIPSENEEEDINEPAPESEE